MISTIERGIEILPRSFVIGMSMYFKYLTVQIVNFSVLTNFNI